MQTADEHIYKFLRENNSTVISGMKIFQCKTMADSAYQQTSEHLSCVVCPPLCTSWLWSFQLVADCCRQANIVYNL